MNILFILIDTLRADHLGCYGYRHPTSPNIDRLAEQGARFERCFAPGIPTTPAHTTLYTGLHPLRHNIVSHGGSVDLDRRIPLFTESLQRAGYTTCAVDNLFDMKPWLARGYEFYINPSHRHRMRLLVSCEEINRRAVAWLRQHASEKFFLFLHYWEPHTPYLPPTRYRKFYAGSDPFDPACHGLEAIRDTPFWGMWGDTWFRKLGPVTDPEYVVSLYDGEISHADEGVGEVLDVLDGMGLAEDTLVVVTADHGEVMVRNGIFFDHHGLYDENIRVPLIIRYPGRVPASRSVPGMLQQSDIGPSILDWADAQKLTGADGRSFRGQAEGLTDDGLCDRVVSCENTWQSKWAVRTDSHKLILSRRPDAYGTPARELYDLDSDPAEQANLVDAKPELAGELETWLEDWIVQGLAKSGRSTDPLMEQELTLGKRWDQWRKQDRT